MSPIVITPAPGQVGLSLADLLAEFYARGYDFLNTDAAGQARAKRWINQAYLEICEDEKWPFLLATGTGAAPATVPDLGSVFTVTNTDRNDVLDLLPEDELMDDVTLLTQVGVPIFYFVDNLTIRVWPVGGSLSIRYYRVPAPMVADADQAIIPGRYCNLIVDGAVRRAANDSEAFSTAQSIEAERQAGLDLMRRALLLRDGLRHSQRRTYPELDG